MAKQRYIKDSFWTDPYIEKLSPDYKLIFLYLLTNPLCNIAGIYEIRPKRVAFETGYDVEVVETILKRFIKDDKLIMVENWIIIKNHLKHQHLGSKTAEGINRITEETPENVKSLFLKKEFSNSDGESYSVYILKDIPHIYPIQEAPKFTYSEVELSKVKYCIYGEFKNVKLTEEEYQKLIEAIGEPNTKLLIEELSGYMASKKKKYGSHYATIKNWARRRIIENVTNKKGKGLIK